MIYTFWISHPSCTGIDGWSDGGKISRHRRLLDQRYIPLRLPRIETDQSGASEALVLAIPAAGITRNAVPLARYRAIGLYERLV